MTIREWLAQSGLSHSAAAEHLGVMRVTLRSWLYAAKQPKPETIAAIETATAGDVTAADWVASHIWARSPEGIARRAHVAAERRARRERAKAEQQLTPRELGILDDVRLSGGIHLGDLSGRIGMPVPSLRRSVALLRRAGLVEPAKGDCIVSAVIEGNS